MRCGTLECRALDRGKRIRYTAHVDPQLVRTVGWSFVRTFRLVGASFESADDELLYSWHELLNVL